MSETVTTGYLVKKIDHKTFDEVLIFLTKEGKKVLCLSLGSKKIMSKNGRNIFYGEPLEIEYFAARYTDKMSKLKKVTSLGSLDWNIQSNLKLIVLNEFVEYIGESAKLFKFYEEKIQQIREAKEDEITFILKAIREFCTLIGINLEVNRCVACSSNILKTISFKHNGMLCSECAKKLFVKSEDIRVSKLFYFLFNNKFDQINSYYDLFPYAIKRLKKYIYDVSGINLLSLKDY